MNSRTWDNNYKTEQTPWRNDQFFWLTKELRRVKDKKALDLGCGTGEASTLLSRFGYSVTGIDFAKEGLKQVPRRIKTIRWDLEALDKINFYNQKFDLILDSKVIAFIKKKDRYLKTISELLSKNGKLIMCGFLKSPKKHICVRPRDIKLIWKYFEPIKIREENNGDTDWFVYVLKRKKS